MTPVLRLISIGRLLHSKHCTERELLNRESILRLSDSPWSSAGVCSVAWTLFPECSAGSCKAVEAMPASTTVFSANVALFPFKSVI